MVLVGLFFYCCECEVRTSVTSSCGGCCDPINWVDIIEALALCLRCGNCEGMNPVGVGLVVVGGLGASDANPLDEEVDLISDGGEADPR